MGTLVVRPYLKVNMLRSHRHCVNKGEIRPVIDLLVALAVSDVDHQLVLTDGQTS